MNINCKERKIKQKIHFQSEPIERYYIEIESILYSRNEDAQLLFFFLNS